MNEPFTLPGGVSLGRRDVYEALAVVGIAAYSSVTIARGSVLTHTFLDRARGRSLRVVESEANQPSEVVGDWALWRRVRAVACELAGRGSVKSPSSPSMGLFDVGMGSRARSIFRCRRVRRGSRSIVGLH